jgi:rsbT antagonist protein RsbS
VRSGSVSNDWTMSVADEALAEPRLVSILSQGPYLIVSIHTALDDSQLQRLQEDLLEQVERSRKKGIVIDVAALDVLDSFATRTLSQIGRAARLKGAETVVVGISPEVAISMVHLSLRMEHLRTALDLEEGLERLQALTAQSPSGSSVDRG